MKQDPIRLIDDLRASRTMRDDLRAADADPGPRYDVDAGAQRFATLVASGGRVATTSGAAAHAAARVLPLGVKVVAMVMLGLVGGTVTWKVLRRDSAGVPAGAISAIPSLDRPPPLPASVPPSAVTGPGISALDAPTGSPVTQGPLAASIVRRGPPHRRSVVSAPSSAISEVQETAPTTKPAPPDGSALKEEMAQLVEIRALARANPARAVEMVRQGHARFAHGVFWQERELLAITSLASLGRHDEARLRAIAVLAQHPESPFAETLRRAIQPR